MTPSLPSGPPPGPPVLVETCRALPLVTLTVALRTGAASEPPPLAGLTHLMALLMRRTAGGLDPVALDTRIDTLGASVSAQVGQTYTSLQATVISRSFEPLVELVGDMLARPSLDPDELERLRRETKSELIDTLDHDEALARRWFRRALFGEHPYGRSTIGTQATVAAWSAPAVRELFDRVVTPDNLVFAFAGDIDAEQARGAASRLMRALPTRPAPLEVVSEPTLRAGRHLVLVDKPERSQTQILIGTLGTRADDADHTALLVANTVLGGTFSARMTQEIRAERGWSYGAYSSLALAKQRQAFSMWTFPKAEDAAACLRHELSMLAEWCDAGVTDEELALAKSYLVRSRAFAVDTAAKRVALGLDEELLGLPDGYHEDFLARVQAVTRSDANAAIRRRIDPTALAIVVVGTASTLRADLEGAVAELASTEVVPFDADP